MKLYYSPGACSLSPQSCCSRPALPYTPEKVNLKTKKTAAGADYLAINSKGSVPALELDDGKMLTEGPAVVQYLADQKPESGLAPRAGTFERYRLMEMLNYITSEVHKGFRPLFNPKAVGGGKIRARTAIGKRFDWLRVSSPARTFLMGDSFTVADAYLFTVLELVGACRTSISANGRCSPLIIARIAQRPKVQQALKEEGLLK